MQSYYVISSSDGDVSVSVHTKEKILEMINENYWGDDLEDMMRINGRVDMTAQGGVVIIKGEQVFPEARRIVETWDID